MKALLPELRPSMAEQEVAAILEYEMRRRGADRTAFQTIAAAGANSSLPHARPGKAKTRKNTVLLIDWGAEVGGYVGDLTRTFTFGRWQPEIARIYDIVHEALLTGIAAVVPGNTGEEVDAAARGVIERAGEGERFSHSLGHGIGLVVHEQPRLAKGSDDVLEEGMVVTVEPGVYIPGVGGVRIEQDVVVRPGGCEVLSKLPTARSWATL